MRHLLSWLDPWVLRRPFEGRSAVRYAACERPAFGDLDERLLRDFAAELGRARTILDLGAGDGAFAERLARACPGARIVAVEPSATFTRLAVSPRYIIVRGAAEALPLPGGSVDFAICLSSLRHVRDRTVALAELRRVVAHQGRACVVELDPAAERARVSRHVRAMRSAVSRLTFDPWVLRTCPSAAQLAALARRAGWRHAEWAPDPSQPFYVMRLS